MNQLITITENNGNKAVSARELHEFLQVETKFATWLDRRIEEYQFVENEDYEVLPNFGKNPQGGRPAIEYAISIDAKELSMVEKTGKEARRYFIAIEKKATAPQPAMLDKNTQHLTLLALLKQNIKRGDMKDVAIASGFTYDAVRNVFYASSRRPEVIKALFEKAMANKKLADNSQDMINQLTQ